MQIDFTLVNVLVLFGSLQGFLLSWLLYKKRSINTPATKFLVLFLFSLSFLNLNYALMDMRVLEAYRPLYIFPFPYKYILAPAFFFYVVHSIRPPKTKRLFNRQALLLFAPAILYGLMRTYWFSIAVAENSYRIVAKLVVSDFFRVNEFVYLLFSITVLGFGLRQIKRAKENEKQSAPKNLDTLRQLTLLFIGLLVTNVVLSIVDLIVHDGDDTMLFNYPHLLINSAFIYWVGSIGLLKPKALISKLRVQSPVSEADQLSIESRLSQVMSEDEAYRQKDLTLSDLAYQIEITPKELSRYLNDHLQVNFSEYLSQLRVEKVKELIQSPDHKKYTLVGLAEEAGFKSKSSFNSTFKKLVGVTPSAFQKEVSQE